MKAVVYRAVRLHGSWRPRSLTDGRGPIFPDEYREIAVLEAEGIEQACDQYQTVTGDVILLGEGDNVTAYVTAPHGWEMVKFGKELRSPPLAG